MPHSNCKWKQAWMVYWSTRIPAGAESQTYKQTVPILKNKFDSLGEAALELLKKMESQNITLTYSQKIIVGAFADAGLDVPLTYEQIAEKSGYALNTVRSLLSTCLGCFPGLLQNLDNLNTFMSIRVNIFIRSNYHLNWMKCSCI